ncbi:PucR-like helix-turn-helix protein [Humibacillus xanthopallidus]|uniref:PucR-like helix-turn-helix protein n=1 Tax=Humibacillus xanthopallidus TaxID=412689 RepID=A0A543PNL6_9MICO|nr:helix-turn-helix domain-containing protein [Humibacillus xanthopallidus]TQN45637.1 PucR-like helix-turn-helix protein [Humibacillus xanthopallidus]
MQELVGRLTSLDPEASETLKVITYFDHLVEGRVGVETMVRGAALLSGAVAGLRRGGRTLRIDPSGARLPDAGYPGEPSGPATSGDSPGWPQRECGDGVVVWLERTAAAHANDAMVLERLAHSVMVSGASTAGDAVARQSLEVLLDTGSAPTDRDRAAARLGLEPRTLLTVVATGGASTPTTPRAALASARMATPYGLVTASLVRGEAGPRDVAGGTAGEPASGGAPTTRVGVGSTVTVDHLPRSWSEALLALRVTTGREPWVRVADLGLLAQAVEAADHASSPPADVAGVERAVEHGWSVEALESLADAESVRAVARAAGLHHSTLQARLADLPTHLGFDVTTGRGRARLHTALIVRRAASARFG